MRFSQKGFTLIEILVVITLITIMILGVINTRFDSSDSDKLNIYNSEIISQIEEVKNNALIGKGVLNGGKLIVPDYWEVVISANNGTTNRGKIITKYKINKDGPNTSPNYKEYSIYNTKMPFIIEKAGCRLLDDTTNIGDTIPEKIDETNNEEIIINIEGSKITTTSNGINCTDNVEKILLKTNISNKRKSIISINKLSGVVQVEKKF